MVIASGIAAASTAAAPTPVPPNAQKVLSTSAQVENFRLDGAGPPIVSSRSQLGPCAYKGRQVALVHPPVVAAMQPEPEVGREAILRSP